MLSFFESDDRSKLKRRVVSVLRRFDWVCSRPSRVNLADCVAKKRDLTLWILCIDGGIQRTMDSLLFRERLDQHVTAVRISGAGGFVAVVSIPFVGLDLGALAQDGICLINSDELPKLAALDELHESLPRDLDPRLKLPLQANGKLCASIAERFQSAGDMSSAICWAAWGATNNTRTLHAHLKLIDLYIQLKEINLAANVAINGLIVFPDNVPLLRKLRNIEHMRGDLETRDAIDARMTQGLLKKRELFSEPK